MGPYVQTTPGRGSPAQPTRGAGVTGDGFHPGRLGSRQRNAPKMKLVLLEGG